MDGRFFMRKKIKLKTPLEQYCPALMVAPQKN